VTTFDEAAFETHRRELHVHCYRMVGNFEAAEDLKAHSDTELRAFKVDVLRMGDGKITEITTFDASLFEAFGLPLTLA
jgi:DNA-directed RNA polymerase specialized sigma24 family protein